METTSGPRARIAPRRPGDRLGHDLGLDGQHHHVARGRRLPVVGGHPHREPFREGPGVCPPRARTRGWRPADDRSPRARPPGSTPCCPPADEGDLPGHARLRTFTNGRDYGRFGASGKGGGQRRPLEGPNSRIWTRGQVRGKRGGKRGSRLRGHGADWRAAEPAESGAGLASGSEHRRADPDQGGPLRHRRLEVVGHAHRQRIEGDDRRRGGARTPRPGGEARRAARRGRCTAGEWSSGPAARSRGSSATAEARSAASETSTPDLDPSLLTFTWRQTLSGASHAGRWSLRRRAMRTPVHGVNPVEAFRHRSRLVGLEGAHEVPLDAPGARRAWKARRPSPPPPGRSFSPNRRCPASHASRMRAAGLVLATATRATLPGGRSKRRSAAANPLTDRGEGVGHPVRAPHHRTPFSRSAAISASASPSRSSRISRLWEPSSGPGHSVPPGVAPRRGDIAGRTRGSPSISTR